MAASSRSASLKEYLKRYESNVEEKQQKKKKKKKAKPDVTGVLVVDEDPVWQKPVKLEEEEEESADEEKPQIDEDIEVKRMKRLEQLKSTRPFGAISEDGSGWISVSDTPNPNPLISDDQYVNSDMSPPRKRRARNDTPSPEEMTIPSHHSGDDAEDDRNVDISPPRKRRARYDTPSPEPVVKPLERERRREVSDLSPPRQQHKHRHTPSAEAKMKRSHSYDSDPDLSPPRRFQTQKSEYDGKTSGVPDLPDVSPPRRDHRSSSYRGKSRASLVEDLSSPRKDRMEKLGTQNESRQSNHNSTVVDVRHVSSVSDLSPPRKARKESTSLKDRPKTGLVSGQDMKEEIAKTKKEELLRFKNMDPSVSGRGAEAVHRDRRTGQIVSKDQLKSEKQEEKPKEVKVEWGKGLAQKREAEARQQELEIEKAKPFARTRDDPELDSMMKERVRWGDPMAHLVKKKHSELVLPDIGDNERMKESGFIVPQEIPSHSWLKRGLEAAPNRYGIRPGRHWDGVDRSNGFEKQMFTRMNEKQATEKEAYLWSVSDM